MIKSRKNTDADKLKVDVLSKEYKNRFDEIIFHSGRYHKQVNFIQLYLTIFGSLVALFFSKDWSQLENILPQDSLPYVKSFTISIAYLISLYLFSNVMDALYATYMNGQRIANIEGKINNLLKDELLTWDSKIIGNLYGVDPFSIGAWVRPNMLVGACSFIFFILTTIILIIISRYETGSFFYFFLPLSSFLTLFLVLNWFLLNSYGLDYIKKSIGEEKTIWSSGLKLDNIGCFIFILNFSFAYIPMFVFGILDAPNVDFPFYYLPTILIADLIILPLFDFYAARVVRSFFIKDTKNKILTSLYALLYASISVYLSFKVHDFWMADTYTSFMDIITPRYAGDHIFIYEHSMTIAGQIHKWYTAIHIFIILIFTHSVISSVKNKINDYKDIISSLKLLLIFSMFSLLDEIAKNALVFKGNLADKIINNPLCYIPLFFLTLLILWAKKKHKMINA